MRCYVLLISCSRIFEYETTYSVYSFSSEAYRVWLSIIRERVPQTPLIEGRHRGMCFVLLPLQRAAENLSLFRYRHRVARSETTVAPGSIASQ